MILVNSRYHDRKEEQIGKKVIEEKRETENDTNRKGNKTSITQGDHTTS